MMDRSPSARRAELARPCDPRAPLASPGARIEPSARPSARGARVRGARAGGKVGSLAIALALPLVVPSFVVAGCGGSNGKASVTPVESASALVAGVSASATSPAASASAPASASASSVGFWPTTPIPSASASSGPIASPSASAGGACWKGFAVTGNAVADANELGRRCAAGMAPFVPVVKYAFKAGETKTLPVPSIPGCYRVIAVAGAGVKDVQLVLTDAAGREIAADRTPDDLFPMLYPNREICLDAVSLLNLSIVVKKGSGDVAGGVWKR